jgi:hypothetical protein
MFFKFNRRFKLLQVDDTFAELLSVADNGDLEFELCYSVKQSEVVHRNALTVAATVISRNIERRPLLENSHDGRINSKALVKNILRQVQNAKTTLKNRESYVAARRNSSILSRVNNENIPQLRAKVPTKLITRMRHTRLQPVPTAEIKQENDVRPLLQMTAHNNLLDIQTTLSSSIELPARRIMHDMIVRQGRDPSTVTGLTHRSLAAKSVYRGLLRPSRAPERSFDPSVRLLHHHLFRNNTRPFRRTTAEVEDQESVHLPVNGVEDDIIIPIVVTIPRAAQRVENRDVSHFLVRFELFDGESCAVIDTVTVPLDVARHLKLFYTPKEPPTVNAVKAPLASKVNLEVRQVDPGATAVRVYKKTIGRATVDTDDYALIGTYDLTMIGQLNVPVDIAIESPAIYRVVPLGEFGAVSSEYTNVVVTPDRYRPIKALAVNAQNAEQGIEIEVREFPPDCAAIEILCRNRSTHEKEWTNVGGVTLIDDATRTAGQFSTVHDTVSDYRVYEYVARVIFRGGTSELAGNTLVERIPDEPGRVDIQITDLIVSHEEAAPNVSFTMRSVLPEQDLDMIRQMMDKQQIQQFFNNDLAKEREFFQGLVAHNVQRVNLTTGQREDFGVITADFFNDQTLRKSQSAEPLRYENKYRYEISALVRSPETLFEKFEKTSVDEVTRKSYTFKPSKFLHPITLREGTLVTSRGLKTRYAKDTMTHGRIGTVETVEVSFDSPPARIIEQNVSRFNKGLNIITWKLEGSIDQIDHFLIMKDVHGVRTVIGKSHSEFEFGNGQYLHPVGELDEGELAYVIVPVFNDYTLGEEETTNVVIV